MIDIQKYRSPKCWGPFIPVLILILVSIPYLARPFWFDEVLTIGWLELDFFRIPFTYPIPNNHIIYTMLLSLWSRLTDSDFFAMRLLSLLGGCAVISMIARYLIRRFGNFAGLCAASLLAVSGCMIQFSTALRGYIFALFFCFAAFLAAERWIKHGGWYFPFLYFILCVLAVGVMPTSLFILCGQALFFLPEIFQKGRRCIRTILTGLLPIPALLIAYAHIFDQLLAASKLKEGWNGWFASYWNLYASFLILILPLIPAIVYGAAVLWKRFPSQRVRLISSGLIFLMPLFLSVLAKVPPFPRIFFPFFGIWIVIFSMLLTPAARSGKRTVLLLFPVLIWIALAPNLTPMISNRLFGFRGDDLLHSYPMSEEFTPDKTAEFLKKQDEPVFIDFDSDPPSLSLQLIARDFPDSKILYDRPDRGPVSRLDSSTLIVCSGEQALSGILRRFGLNGNYECVFAEGIQKVYRKQ